MNKYDVVCIGAGISGLYLGYQMIQRDPVKSLLIIDRLDRVGGKLVSVPLDGVEYEAEGCASRFMSNQELIRDLMNDMGQTWTEVGYSSSSVSGDEFLESLRTREPTPEDSRISNLDGITNWPSMERGSFDNPWKVSASTGYEFSSHTASMESTMGKISATIPNVYQYYPNGGFSGLAQKLAEVVSKRYDILLSTEAEQVSISSEPGYKYRIVTDDGEYHCKNLVFTGDRHRLNMMGGDSTSLRTLKSVLYDAISTDMTYLKMYLTVDNPWWTEDEVGHVINDIGPINQIYYVSGNTLCLYVDSGNADTLFFMVPTKYRGLGVDNIQWISMDDPELTKLQQFVRHYITKMVVDTTTDQSLKEAVRFMDFNKMAFKHTPQASVLWAPMDIPVSQLTQSLNNYDNIHLISDAYSPVTGWIEEALRCVVRNYSSIVR